MLSNLWTEWVFRIDEQNVYHRNTGYVLMIAITSIYLVYSTAISWRQARKSLLAAQRREYLTLSCFILPPVIGAVTVSYTHLIPIQSKKLPDFHYIVCSPEQIYKKAAAKFSFCSSLIF